MRSQNGRGSRGDASSFAGTSVSRTSDARLARLENILLEERQKRIEAEKEIADLKVKVHGTPAAAR